MYKKLVKIDKLCECRKHEIYEGKKIRKFGKIDKMWNGGNPEVRTSEKVEIK